MRRFDICPFYDEFGVDDIYTLFAVGVSVSVEMECETEQKEDHEEYVDERVRSG